MGGPQEPQRGATIRGSGKQRRRLVLTTLVVALVLAGASVTALGIPQRIFLQAPESHGQVGITTKSISRSTPASPERPGTFVTANGSQMVYDGQPLHLYGYTFYAALDGGSSAWHNALFTQYIDKVIALGQMAGQNLLRPTDFWDSTNTDQVWNDPTVWANMDYLVQDAQRHGMFVVMDLSAYAKLLESQGQDPYNAANWKSYLDFVGARYANSTSIAFYSIVGEPPVPTTIAATTNLLTFYQSVTDELYQADGGHHLIAAGGLIHMEDAPTMHWWQQIYALPHNDLCAFKTYSQHDLTLMPSIAAYAHQLNKPLIDEEFGMPQYLGDAVATGQSFNSISTSRAQFFSKVYTEGSQNGVSGFIFWNLGCQIGNTSYDVSPLTPAVWQVVTAHGPVVAVPWPESLPPC